MRLLSAMRVLLVLIFLSPSALFAQSSPGASSATVPRLINISGVFRPADGQPAGAGGDRHAVDLCRPGGRSAPLAGDADHRTRCVRAATRCSSAPASRTGSRRTYLAPARRGGWARCSRARRSRRGRACGSPACRMRCARPMPTRSAAGRRRRTCWRRPPGDERRQRGVEAADGEATAEAPSREHRAGRHDEFPRQVRERHRRRQLRGLRERTGRSASARRRRWTRCTSGSTTPTARRRGWPCRTSGNTATSYSGMLFYDQIGALGQFQGFNNVTHEYRINNIARVRRAARSTARSTS